MADIDVKLNGLDEALRAMRGVAPQLLKSGLRSAATAAMRIARDDARNRVKGIDDPETASQIYKNIATQYSGKASKREGGVVVKVGVRGGARPRKGTEDTGHWRFVEFGKEGVPARPFMRPALEANVQRITDKFLSGVGPALDKAIERARKRGKA